MRVTGSGLGCPDWPLCHGGILPPLEQDAVIEYAHRLMASLLVGPLVLAIFVFSWAAYRHQGWLLALTTLALVLTLGQAILGRATVEAELTAETVAAHLALGEALLGCLVLIMVISYRGPLALRVLEGIEGAQRFFPLLALASAIAVYAILLTGSYVTVASATWACTDWPLCQGEVFPGYKLGAIHMAHRLVAAVLGLFVICVLHLGFRRGRQPRDVRLFSMGTSALFLAQILVGAATVWLNFPVEVRALHLALGTAVWGAIVGLVALVLTPHAERTGETAHA